MRYEKGRKELTRHRILEMATTKFKERGIEGTGLKVVMASAGLTNGAFYAHFPSKDGLVRESVDEAFKELQVDLLEAAKHGGLEAVLRQYLSVAHRDNPGPGCPSAALLPELARQSNDVRKIYTDRFNDFVAAIQEYLTGQNVQEKQTTARALFGLAVGSLQLARAVADEKLSADILEGAVQAALKLV